MTAGIETLELLGKPGTYELLETKGCMLEEGLTASAKKANRQVTVARVGSLLTLFFAAGPIHDWATADASDRKAFAAYFHKMLEQGIYLPPSQFEAMFISLAHSEEDIARSITAAASSLS